MEAVLRDGTHIVPGDKVMVMAKPMRMWGGRAREDAKAEPIRAAGTVMSITFERDFETNELTWYADVAVKIPINDPVSAWIRMYDQSLKVPPDQIERVLAHATETEAVLCGEV